MVYVPSATGPFRTGRARVAPDREVAYAEWGDPEGWPVFFFHGLGASRSAAHPDGRLADAAGARVIAVDRPGIGGSDIERGRRLRSWARDVAAVADALGIERYGILAHSGGGPHALACAVETPGRVTRIGIASGGAPLAGPVALDHLDAHWRRIAYVSANAPWVVRAIAWLESARAIHKSMRAFDRFLLRLPPRDRWILESPVMKAMIDAGTRETFQQGSRGFYEDALVLSRPWGFGPMDIEHEVTWWHGDADSIVPIGWATTFGALIPRCTLHVYAEEGHFLYLERWREMLESVVRP